MSENNFTDVFNDPNLPVDNQNIDEIEEVREPEESIDSEEDQDTPPIAQTHEEVLQNLERNGENENFLRAEAHRTGVDMDDKHYPADEYNREKL